MLEACGEIFDLQRAQEWTTALEKWCASQPDLVPYRGHCLVRRAELLQLHGAWEDALEWARRAAEWLSSPTPKQGVGSAFYQVGEIHRLRGKFADSEEAYRQASQWSRSPGPGLAQLRLAQGRVEAAYAAIRRMAEEVHEPASSRPRSGGVRRDRARRQRRCGGSQRRRRTGGDRRTAGHSFLACPLLAQFRRGAARRGQCARGAGRAQAILQSVV